jgi:hypothetical protein
MKRSIAVASAVLVVVILAAGWYVLQKPAKGKTKSATESEIAAAMKQEIFHLKKSLNGNANFVFSSAFAVAVQAELSGDKHFANEDYEAARLSYAEALGNFTKAAGSSKTDSTAQSWVNPTTNPDEHAGIQRPPSSDRTAKLIIERDKFIERARQRLAVVESETRIRKSTPVLERESAVMASTPEATRSEQERTRKSEVQSEGEAKPVEVPAADFGIVNVDSSVTKTGAAGTPDETMTTPGRVVQPDLQRERPSDDTVRRDLARLVDAYQISLAAKDLAGFKALFRESFLIKQEKEWANFFAQAADVRASVEAKNYKIDALRSEIDLVVTIRYSNRKGIAQKPLRYSEGWTLERQNGNWTVVARRFE